MKLSFNKKPTVPVINNQLNLFSGYFKKGDFVYILTSKTFGIIVGINTEITVHTYIEKPTYLEDEYIVIAGEYLIPAKIEPIMSSNIWNDWKIGDICTYTIHGQFFVKIFKIGSHGKPVFYNNSYDDDNSDSYYDNVYILRRY